MTEKQKRTKWEEFVTMIVTSTYTDNKESEETREARKAMLEAAPEEWFKYYFPKFAYAPAANFHKEATGRILAHEEWYEVRMWSRELAKSTRTMMEVLYLTLVGHPKQQTQKKYVLLISNSLDNAERLLMPYRANLEYNKRLVQDYGEQPSDGKWQSAEFVTRQGVAFRALGVGQSPRGARNEEARPDIILFDDVDTDADCLNPELVARKWRWIEEAAIGARSVSKATTIIFCGNRIATDTCIQRATNLADHVDEVNIRDEKGISTWPEKNSEVDIDRVLSQKSYAAQQKEYYNNPLTEGAVFSQLAYKPARPLTDYSVLVCYTDPSYKSTGDYKATVLVGKWEGEFHIIRCYLQQATTAEMIQWHLNIMQLVGGRSCYYHMEQVFMQDTLVKAVSDEGRKLGITIPISGDTRQKPDKYMRIESLLEPMHRNGELYFNEAEKQNPHMVRLAEQFIAFGPGSRAHDDGPDAVEGAVWQIINRHSKNTAQVTCIPRPANKYRV